MRSPIKSIAGFHDKLFHFWESSKNNRIVGSSLVIIYIGYIILIQLNIMELLPPWLTGMVSTNFFDAINVVFVALLAYEVILLIFTLAESITRSLIKQFELLTLILLRDAFKAFGAFHQPLDWQQDLNEVLYMITDSFGALVIFLLIVLINRMLAKTSKSIAFDNQKAYINFKKMVALVLAAAFIIMGLDHLGLYFITEPGTDFFETFYTILIFTDILLVLIALRYSTSYIVVFRNSGFALATVFIRLALVAPPYYNVAIGIAAATFVLGLVYFYTQYYHELKHH